MSSLVNKFIYGNFISNEDDILKKIQLLEDIENNINYEFSTDDNVRKFFNNIIQEINAIDNYFKINSLNINEYKGILLYRDILRDSKNFYTLCGRIFTIYDVHNLDYFRDLIDNDYKKVIEELKLVVDSLNKNCNKLEGYFRYIQDSDNIYRQYKDKLKKPFKLYIQFINFSSLFDNFLFENFEKSKYNTDKIFIINNNTFKLFNNFFFKYLRTKQGNFLNNGNNFINIETIRNSSELLKKINSTDVLQQYYISDVFYSLLKVNEFNNNKIFLSKKNELNQCVQNYLKGLNSNDLFNNIFPSILETQFNFVDLFDKSKNKIILFFDMMQDEISNLHNLFSLTEEEIEREIESRYCNTRVINNIFHNFDVQFFPDNCILFDPVKIDFFYFKDSKIFKLERIGTLPNQGVIYKFLIPNYPYNNLIKVLSNIKINTYNSLNVNYANTKENFNEKLEKFLTVSYNKEEDDNTKRNISLYIKFLKELKNFNLDINYSISLLEKLNIISSFINAKISIKEGNKVLIKKIEKDSLTVVRNKEYLLSKIFENINPKLAELTDEKGIQYLVKLQNLKLSKNESSSTE